MPAISVSGLKKHYGTIRALDGVEFAVEPGEVVGLLGPNGAGKSTAMKVLTGYLAPTAGSVQIMDAEVLEDPVRAQEHLGYLPEAAPIYPEMFVEDYLDFVGQVRGMGSAERAAACARVLKRCGLEDRARQVVGTLSKGYRQRVGLAQAILHEPQILILDEPTSGLDPNQIIEIRALIRELGERKTVLLSTHILSEVKATCDRVIIIHAGKIVADGPTESVMRMDQGERIDLVLAPGDVRLDPEQITAGVSAIDGVLDAIPQVGAQLGEGECALQIRAEGDLRSALFSYAVDSGLVLLEMHRQSSNLEDVFRRLTRGEAEVGLSEKEPGQ